MADKNTQYYLADISSLIPYARNSRTHTDEQVAQVAASIREFGFLNPVIIAEDNTILAGHARVLAARKLGLDKVPCIKAENLTEAQKRAYIIADNKLSLNAGWDEELLAVEISDLKNEAFDLSLLGFDEKELDKLLSPAEEDVKEDDFDIDSELEKPAFSKEGDLWTIGRHRLLCGDSTLPESFERLMGGIKANLTVTDPPYNVNYKGVAGKIKNDNMGNSEFYSFLLEAFNRMHENMASDASIYVFHADTEGLNFRKAFDEAGFHLSGCCIWKKHRLMIGHSPYQWQHEPCLFGWPKGGKHHWYSDRKQSTIWEFDKPSRNDLHPTMKPMALIAYVIMNSSMSNTVVLDPFLGSGTTMMVCQQSDRTCYGVELDPKYCDVIVNRYIELVGNADGITVERNGTVLTYEQARSLVESTEESDG
ncbi:MAG: site-specific DNA-methyltransferase [Oscillospiraceae bacterium]|nr:site-specific DNA-methyltransferase [Oscillospiraceae bacterium]